MTSLRTTTFLIAVASIITLTGCARFPDTLPTTGKQLVVTMQVRGRINPLDPNQPNVLRHYFVAIDSDAQESTGPVAVYAPPYGGTGWVTTNTPPASPGGQLQGLTSFLRYDAANPQGSIYGIIPGSSFLNVTPPQPPIRYEILQGGSAIRFVIDFSQIETAAIPAGDITQLNVNFITANALPVSNVFVESRQTDGLGASGQDFVTIDTSQDRIYSGQDYDALNLTPTDPDLDITSWQIEVQTVSSR